MNDLNFIADRLLSWFEENKRELPWRTTADPYKIWISEIILQQTRVAQGLDYYLRFVDRFPDIKTLASADEQEVLKHWQGLGYYSRARNLHKAARILLAEYNASFPVNDHQAILQLPGIGDYTAAAIVSFAWNMPYPVVDGNVFRFLSRLFMIDVPIDSLKGKKYFTKLAGEIMDKSKAGLFNQAIMEFGALQCVPSSPDCMICPFVDQCMAYNNRCINDFPVKANKARTKDLYLYYFHIIDKDKNTYLVKRTEKGIWQNLFEFPLVESEMSLSFSDLSASSLIKMLFPEGEAEIKFREVIKDKKHVLSHRVLHATFYQVEASPKAYPGLLKINENDIHAYPVHRLMQHYIESQ